MKSTEETIASIIFILSMLLIQNRALAFTSSAFCFRHKTFQSVSSTEIALSSKGFDAEKSKPRPKSEGEAKRQKASSKYDEIASQGGQEYRILVRKFGSADDTWLPCGAIAVPRGAQVSAVIFAEEKELKKAIVRVYPKLIGQEIEFEFGYNLKMYPDDPIEVAVKPGSTNTGPSFSNWVSTLLSPVDASQVKPPTES